MPTVCTLRSRDYEDVDPARPETEKAYPKQPVQRNQPRARLFSSEHVELLTLSEDFDGVNSASSKEGSHRGERNQYEFKYGALRSTISGNDWPQRYKSLILHGGRLWSRYNPLARRCS